VVGFAPTEVIARYFGILFGVLFADSNSLFVDSIIGSLNDIAALIVCPKGPPIAINPK
jgi:hypothetical protein